MDLRKKDIAELLTVSIQTIDALIDAGKIPTYSIKGELRFNRTEIENWMMKTLSLEKDTLPFGENESNYGPWQQFGLYRAIHKGDVLSNLSAMDKEEIIRQAMDATSETLHLDPEIVTELLLEREHLMPTALNNGVAIPHTREFLLRGLFDAVVVVYPTSPMDWGALDGAPVHTLFFLFACDDKRHLNLLAKVAHLSSSKEALEFLQTKPSKQALLEYIKNWEASIQSQRILV